MAVAGVRELCLRLLGVRCHLYISCRYKNDIDYSKFPKLNEEEVEEQFIKGHGPGGSNVNKTINCVLLKHLPTGIVIKCHHSRLMQKNRELARELLLNKLDEFYNKDFSVSAQQKKIGKMKMISKKKKQEKLRELKRNFLKDSNENKS